MSDRSEPDVDLLMASLQADQPDITSYFEVLAYKLRGALGGRVEVQHDGGLFRRQRRARRIAVVAGESEFSAALTESGIDCAVKQVVRGITLRTEQPSFPDWLRGLVEALAVEATRSETTWTALRALLT